MGKYRIPLWTSDVRRVDVTDFSFFLTWIVCGIAASFVSRFVVNLNVRDMSGCFAIGYVSALVIHFVSAILLHNYIQAQFEASLLAAIAAGAISGGTGSLMWKRITKKGRRKNNRKGK